MAGKLQTTHFVGGQDWSIILTVQQDGAAVDLTQEGWLALRSQWRPAAGAARSIDLTVDSSQVATGVITLSLTGAQVRQMSGPGVFDLWSTDASGLATQRLTCQTTWEQGVTR